MDSVWDMLVLGGGPGGYTAALYGARAGLRTLVLEKLCPGGQMALTERIDNYPGFPEGVDGIALGERMRQGAERFGAGTVLAEARELALSGPVKEVSTSEGVFYGRTVVLATGAGPRPLGLPGEEGLLGRGVSYCAACDGTFYRGKTVAVVGGGSSAAGDALLLSRLCKKVYLIHRRDTLRADRISREALEMAENVEFRWNSNVTALLHGERLTGIRIRNESTGAESEIACDALFVCIGRKPASDLVRGKLALDDSGYVVAVESTETGIPGVFAVGDVRAKAVRQVVTAVGDGAAAAHSAGEYLARQARELQ